MNAKMFPKKTSPEENLTPELRSDPLLVKERVKKGEVRQEQRGRDCELLSSPDYSYPLLNKERVGTEFRGEVFFG